MQPETHPRLSPGLVAATRAHTQPFPRGPAGAGTAGVCSPPAWPVGSLSALHLLSAQQGLGLLRHPPHMTCGELFRVEGAPRGGCSLHTGPARLPPSRLYFHSPGILHHRVQGSLPFPGCCGRPEIRPRRPPQATHVPSPEGASFHGFSEAPEGNGPRWARGPVFKFDHVNQWHCGAWFLRSVAGAQGFGGGPGKKLRALLANFGVKCQ